MNFTKKVVFLLTGLLIIQTSLRSQEANRLSPQDLKEYEGLYEYINNVTLTMAASPVDTTLYAVIDKSKYPLSATKKDLFVTRQNNTIQFYRNKSNTIVGYLYNGDTLHQLGRDVSIPISTWYPRMNAAHPFQYIYNIPKNDGDGLLTGTVILSGLDTALLAEMVRKIVDRTYPDVHSVLIIRNGKLVFEEYFYEYGIDTVQELRSTTKSFISALTGIAIDNGFIKGTQEKVLQYFPDYHFENQSPLLQQLTIKHLLTNQTGLDCDIANQKTKGNENSMYNSDDWVKFSLDLPMVDTPGGKGMYCTGNSIILGKIVEKQTKQSLTEFAQQKVFAPLHFKNVKWRFKPDRSSAETFGQLNLRPRDMAKFGLLFLNKGKWQGKQIISSAWCEQSLKKHSVIQGVDYGYQWWIKYLDADGVRYYGKAAQGNGGQKIYIWEQQNMVTVITGGNYNMQSPTDELIKKYILPAFNK